LGTRQTHKQLKAYASVATSAEPRNNKEISLRKFNCLSEASFEFLEVCLLFVGNLTK